MFSFEVALVEAIISFEIKDKFVGKMINSTLVKSIKYFVESKINEYYCSGLLDYKPEYTLKLNNNQLFFELIPTNKYF